MTDTVTGATLAWLLTYAIHSTLFLGLAALITRRIVVAAPARDFVWKLALLGGLVTATVQLQGGVHPFGSVALTGTRAVARAPRPRDASERTNVRSEQTGNLERPVGVSARAEPMAGVVTLSEERLSTARAEPSATTGSVSASIASGTVFTWAALALLLAVWYLARRLMLAGRLTTRRPVTEGPMVEMLESLRVSFDHRATVHLTSANTISSPVALGLSEICVPDAALTDLDAEQQRSLLAHELAHLSRRDPLWLDAASLIERVFFFQPLNRLARREVQRNAEYICDDWAASRAGSGEPLARCLARVAEWIEAAPLGVPVAGMAEQRSMLVTRIARLLEGRPMLLQLSRATKSIAIVAALGLMIAAAPSVHGALPEAVVQQTSAETSTPVKSDRGDSTVEQDPAIIAALIDRLVDSNAGVRRAAASSLGRLKARKAVPALLGIIGDKNREVRGSVAEALGEIEDDRALPALVKLVGDESPEVRERALDALGHFEHEAPVAPVIVALSDSRPQIRSRAADLLGSIGDRAAVQPLVKLLRDPVADVRRGALSALERLKDPSVVSAVTPLLGDTDADVRAEALGALRELRSVLPESTIAKLMDDPSHAVRQRAIEVAKEQPPSASLVALLRKAALEDANIEVREAAVEALSEVRSPAARDALRQALTSADARVRRAAAEALGSRP